MRIAGHLEYNEDQRLHREPSVGYWGYLHSAHFVEALSENWESEFLQIFAYRPYRWLSSFCRSTSVNAAPPSPSRWTRPTTRPAANESLRSRPASRRHTRDRGTRD